MPTSVTAKDSPCCSHTARNAGHPYREVGTRKRRSLSLTPRRASSKRYRRPLQLKHTSHHPDPRQPTQLRLFAPLRPITNATVEGNYPIEAGLTGLPAGEAAFLPRDFLRRPNAPTQWRGTNARAFTEALNTYTLQNNLQWIKGNHSVTFGFQGQRLDANEFERALGSNAVFSFSNLQTAGFNANGAVNAGSGNAYASFLLGAVNNTNVIEDSAIGTSGRFYNAAWWVSDDFKVSPKLTLNLGLRYDIMLPYREKYDRWSFFNPELPNPAASGYPGALQFAGDGPNSCNCRTPIKTNYGLLGPRVGFAYNPIDKLVLRGAYGIMYSRRGAVGGRGGARNGTG